MKTAQMNDESVALNHDDTEDCLELDVRRSRKIRTGIRAGRRLRAGDPGYSGGGLLSVSFSFSVTTP